jgi:hypothetical protein
MANAKYPKFLEALLSQSPAIDLDTDVIKLVLVDLGAYTYSAAHQFLSDIPIGARVFTSGALSGKTVTNGVFDALDLTLTAVTGVSVEALVLFKDTGVAATSPLIAYWDTGVSGLPYNPTGVDVTIPWDNGANKIFAL